MLVHVLNGDAMVESFAASGVSGEVIVWAEAAIDGPLAPDMGSAVIRDARAEWFERELCIAAADYRRDFDQRERALAELPDRADLELVLWFERDLFCELHLLDLLGRTAGRAWQVAVVHPPTLALMPSQLRDRFEDRRACTTSERQQARAAWSALASQDPREFFALTSDSPWLAELLAGMQADRLGCFPDTRGLTRFDALAIEWTARGCSPLELFRQVGEHAQTRRLGLGDLQVWQRLAMLVERGLIDTDEPLPRADLDPPPAIDRPSLRASAEGLALLAGHAEQVGPLGVIGAVRAASWRRVGSSVEPV